MNIYTEITTIEKLAIAMRIMESRSGTWDKGMSVEDHVAVKMAVEAAHRLIRDDLVTKAI
jgi:hypothetical protein